MDRKINSDTLDMLGEEGYENLLAKSNPMIKKWKLWIPNKMVDVKTPEMLKDVVLQSKRIYQVIEAIAGADKTKQGELLKTVAKLLDEIGFKRNYSLIKALGIVLSHVFPRIYSGLQVNRASVERLKLNVRNTPVLYLPSHRSYMDFVLISYVSYSYDVYIPAIAAGMDFLNMAFVGEMLRKTGAFYMRRTFANDKLYWAAFKEYIHTLMTRYHGGIEFFLEGTRSRSGKSLPPKIGLLSMALEPLFMGEVPDITIVPIAISYDKPLEEQLFVYELLGVPKPKETTTGLFKALKILNDNFGSVYYEYGKPISVKEYFGADMDRFRHSIQPPHVQELAPDELSVISGLAHHVVNQTQDRIIMTTFNLAAVVFNHSQYRGESLGLGELCARVNNFGKLLTAFGAVVDQTTIDKLKSALDVHSNILSVQNKQNRVDIVKSKVDFYSIDKGRMKAHKLSNQAMSVAVPIFSLQLYINPTIHWLAPAALLFIVAKKFGSNAVDQETLYAEWLVLRNMFAVEFVFHPNTGKHEFQQLLRQLQQLKLVQLDGGWVNLMEDNASTIDLIISVLPPFLTCYLNTTEAILNDIDSVWVNEKEILCLVQRYIESRLLSKSDKVHPYCLSLDSIALALQSFHFNVGCLDRKRG